MNKTIIGAVVIAVVAAGAGFFGGMKYGQSRAPAGGGQFNRQAGAQGARRFAGGNGLVGGQVLSKDASSITLKLPTGGSSIVFYSPSTTIEKTASGSWNDVTVGSSVIIRGTQNPDGTYAAQSVQLSRMPMPMSPQPSPLK